MPQRQAEIPTIGRSRAALGDPRPANVETLDRRRRPPWMTIALFLLPAFALYVVFVITPVVQAVFYSVFDWSGLGPIDRYVGLGNYRRAAADPVFLSAVRHNWTIVVLSLALQLPFALAMALILNSRIRGRALLRLLFFAPFVVAEVTTGVVWTLMLQPGGLTDRALSSAGLGAFVQHWLANPDIVLYTLFVVISWKYFGLHMILYLAGLQEIPDELAEASAIDGATPLQTFRYVTLPLLGPTIRISVFLSIIGSLQLFDLIWVMTGGGPINASNTMATYMIEWGFRRFQLGYGSAVAVILFGMALVIAFLYQRFVLRRDIEGAVTTVGVR
jgi:raffinose/stachyose/melibiose transport system permease protein